jgi:predicted metal-dependent phosphoesterase TrpH
VTVDLHIHSNASDGAYSGFEIASIAAVNGIGAIAITDHESIDGIPDTMAGCTSKNIQLVVGIELSAHHSGIPIDILGYSFNLHDSGLSSMIARNRTYFDSTVSEGLHMIECDVPKVSIQEFMEFSESANHTSARYYRVYDYLRSKQVSIDLSKYFIWNPVFSVEQICSVINEADGIPIFAHPGFSLRSLDPSLRSRALTASIEAGIKGLECFHPAHSNTVTVELIRFCKDNGLMITGGSDFHGPNHTNNKLMGVFIEQLSLGRILSR